MKLLEVIPLKETKKEVIDFMTRFGRTGWARGS